MIVGLTGPSGAGKSEAAGVFERHGFSAIDADGVAHLIYRTNRGCVQKLQRTFGYQVAPGGQVDRKVLAGIVFSSPDAIQRLNELMFPYITEQILIQIRMSKKDDILLDAPLLFESGLSKICQHSVGVLAPYFVRKDRIVRRDQLNEKAADKRLRAQPDDSYYKERCDVIIWNDGTRQQLEDQICRFLSSILSERRNCE